MNYVIIGNSAAAIGAVEGIRQIDKEGKITIISDEKYHTYSRPLISYYLKEKTSEEEMIYRSKNFYHDNNCELILDKKIIAINAEDRTVTAEDGIPFLSYDSLLVATGSSAFIPPFEGIDTVKNQFSFMSLDDAKALNKLLDNKKRVLIVGAGLIGLKCAEGIRDKVEKVTVVDLAPKVLSSILDDDASKIVQEELENAGINIILSHSVKRFEKDIAILDNDEQIDFDILVMAVGVRPNTSLLSGIAKIGRGIIIDDKSQTSVRGIYAAGDCTETFDLSCGQNKIMALLPNAYMQGECAGLNMAGGDKIFSNAIPMNAIGFFGLHMVTAGSYIGNEYVERGENSYKKLFYSNNKLNGFIIVGDVAKSGIYTSLIREQTALDSIDFDLICKNPSLIAFTKEDRVAKLGVAK